MGSAHKPGSEVISVDVPGGALAVEMISSATAPVLAIHGISSLIVAALLVDARA